jgi:hypothetical protein
MLPLIVTLLTLAAGAPPLASAQQDAGGAVVRGSVYDSLARAPLGGATVQIVAAGDPASFGRTATSDERGKFEFRDIPSGEYAIGFLHPLLDSLGISAPVAAVSVVGSAPVEVALAIPSPERLRAAVCSGNARLGTGAVIVGTVRGARGLAPRSGVTVTARWAEFAFRTGGADQRIERVTAVTAANGWFGFCGLPASGTVVLTAGRGADSTDAIEVDLAASGFQRRDLYLGTAQLRAGGLATGAGPLQTGDGRLHGIVVAAEGGRPIAGARVAVVGGPETVANAAGEWALENVPTGTRTLEARGIGFYPVRRPVDVVAGAPAVQLSLSSLRSLLDTVRVTASRLRLEGTGFEDRRRSGLGRYITAEQIARRKVAFTSELFRTVPGVRLDRGPLGETHLTVRGAFGRCAPNLFIDGHHMLGLSAEDIETWAHPDDVAGIEIYAGAVVPPEFQPGMTGCGSIVLWTRRSSSPVARWSWRKRAATGIGAVVLGFGIGALLQRF